MSVYHGEFNCWADVQRAFAMGDTEDGKVVLHADYDLDTYDGHAVVLWHEAGGFRLVDAYHCSCYGLSDDLWHPEETPLDALLRMGEAGKFGSDVLSVLRDLKASGDVA